MYISEIGPRYCIALVFSIVLLTAIGGQFHIHAAALTEVQSLKPSERANPTRAIDGRSSSGSHTDPHSYASGDFRNVREFVCGDADASGGRDIADIVYLINYIFSDGIAPQDPSGGDYDCDGGVTIADVVFLINWMFGSGPAPCEGTLCGGGVLLPGNADSLAVKVTYKYGPIAADSAEIDSTGLLKSRLSALINPGATVGAINAALSLIDGKISWMSPGALEATVMIPAVASRVEADSLAALLAQSGAFLYAYAAYGASLNGASEISELPPTGTADIAHLIKMRMPAAWNVKHLAEQVNTHVNVEVPDCYYVSTPHPEIPSQQFDLGHGKRSLTPTSDGNHGFCVSGVIGAHHDNLNATGIHPLDGLLTIHSLMIGGLTASELSDEIVAHFPSGRFVLNTSLGYLGDLIETPKLARVLEGMHWRRLARPRKNDFIHVSSAGNEGMNTDDSRYAALGSQFNIAAAFDSPFEIYKPGEIGLIDSVILSVYWNYALIGDPFLALKLDNLIATGSSDTIGNESSFSSSGSVVRCLGESVSAPCVRPEPASESGACTQVGAGLFLATYDGTSFAAPQVAGLAAYLLNLDPTLTNSELKDIITQAYVESTKPGFVDAYAAVLALDHGILDAPIRKTLLDVASAPGVEGPDGSFDEIDIEFLINKFTEYEQLRQGVPSPPEDYSRFDLNGDGYTGGWVTFVPFDLTADNPPAYSLVTRNICGTDVSFNESNLDDYFILIYYSFSPLFTGDEAIRNSFFECVEK